MAHEFKGDICAEAAGEVADSLYTGLGGVGLRDVDGFVGAEGAGQVEPRGNAVDGDDGAGAAGFGHGGGVKAQTAGALDGHAFAGAKFGAVKARDHLGEGAVDTGDGRVG